MSIALATKGIISGFGGGGAGEQYPSGYIASAIEVEIDFVQGIVVGLSNNNIGVSVDLGENVLVDVNSSSVGIEVTTSDEIVEVNT